MQVQRMTDGEWKTQQTGKGKLLLQALAKEPGHYEEDHGKIKWVDYPLEQWEKGNKHVKELEKDQANGISLLNCMYVKGLNEIACLKGIEDVDINSKEYVYKIKSILSEKKMGRVWQ